LLLQAVDSNSLKSALERWFDGLDVESLSIAAVFSSHLYLYVLACIFYSDAFFLQTIRHSQNFKQALLLTLDLGVGLKNSIH
jgi:hypothetical protein